MENNPMNNENTEVTPKKGMTKKQKQILAGALAAVALVGAGTAVYFATRPNNASTETNVAEITENAGVGTPNFNDYADYTLSLKDGENAITEGGIYAVSGSTNGYIHVNLADDKNVKLVLNSVSITSSGTPAIFVENAKNVVIELVGDNTLTTTVGTDHPASIFSKDDLLIQGDGSLAVTSTEDGIVSKDDLEIASGTITISAADDGIRGNDSVKISGGTIDIQKSKEGIESEVVVIAGGNISIVATDDGINAADKNGEGNPISLTISGGTTYANCGGDGLDSNGSIYVSGGTTYVDGPTNAGNGALDYDGTMEVTGGTLIATGASGMAMNATSSTQPSLLVGVSANTSGEITIGNLSYTPKKSYGAIYITSDTLKIGETYDLKAGSTTTSVDVSKAITNVNIMSSGPMGGQPQQNQSQSGQSAQPRQMMRR